MDFRPPCNYLFCSPLKITGSVTSLWTLMSVCWSRLVCRLVIIFYKKKREVTLSCRRPIEVLVFDMYVLWFFREYGAVQRNKSSFFGAVWAYPRILFKPAGQLRHIAITWRHVLDWRHVFIKLKSCLGVQRRGAKVNRPPWYILDLTKNVYICQYSPPRLSLWTPLTSCLSLIYSTSFLYI